MNREVNLVKRVWLGSAKNQQGQPAPGYRFCPVVYSNNGRVTPDVVLVDFNLRGGERADGLIDRLHGQGVRVIVISGYEAVPLAPGKVEAILQKPVSAAQLLGILRPAQPAR